MDKKFRCGDCLLWNEAISKLFNKLADEQQKLDSIRELLRNAPIPLEEIPEAIAKILGGLNNE